MTSAAEQKIIDIACFHTEEGATVKQMAKAILAEIRLNPATYLDREGKEPVVEQKNKA